MKKIRPEIKLCPEEPKDVLTKICRQGARRLLQQALETEVENHLSRYADNRDEAGRRQVVRNGYLPGREIQTGIGGLKVEQPRARDKRNVVNGEKIKFTSRILPPYLRKTKQMEELIPWLYLKGVSSGDFCEALQALLGPEAKGLSANTIVRLKQVWAEECKEWSRRSLADKRYIYFWVDGIHFDVRLEEEKTCILVIMGATATGEKELVAIRDGYRESEQSWKELLLDIKGSGLKQGPELSVGDGALGFWKALRQVFTKCRTQRCWVHKTANVLNKLPKSVQPKAKADLHEIWMSERKSDAEKAFSQFVEKYGAKYPQAVECLAKDREELMTFYDFPAEHWAHLRTTNPIESTFATVRLRTVKTKGCGTRLATLTMVFKLAKSAEKRWRKLNAHEKVRDVMEGIRYEDGMKIAA